MALLSASLWQGLQWLLLLLVLLACGSVVIWTWRLGISPIPSSPKVQAAIERWLRAHPLAPGLVIEPGAGWGGLAFRLARLLPEHQIVAYERSFVPWLWIALQLRLRPQPNLTLRKTDLHEAPWQDASLVVCYLFTGAMARLQEPLAERLSEGSYVLSNTFSLPGWTPHDTIALHDLYRTRLYVYKVPESTPKHSPKDGETDAPPADTRTDR